MKIRFFLIALLCMTVLIYGKSLGHQFVGDDEYLIVRNHLVKSWDHLPQLFKKNYLSTLPTINLIGTTAAGSGELTYRPVCTLSYFFDYFIWKLNPFGFHLTNLLLHMINALLIYVLALRLNLSRAAATLAALAFFLHPVNNEVVAVITSRDDSLAFLFFGLAMLFYQNFRNSGYQKLPVYLLSLLAYGLALFSKEIAVTLPLIIMLYDYCFPSQRPKSFRERFKFYANYGIILLFYVLIWFFIMRPSHAGMVDYFAGNLQTSFLTLVRILALYLKWLIFPWDIPATIADGGIVIKNIFHPVAILSLVSVFGTCFLGWMAYQRGRKRFLFALLWSIVTLLPVLALAWMLNVIYAARFLYIPMIGFCFILALVWDAGQKHFSRRFVMPCLGAALLAFYSLVTVSKLPNWQDNLSLGLARLRHYPQNTTVYLNIAKEFERTGYIPKALDLYHQIIIWDPGCAECHNQLGLLHLKQGELEHAAGNFQTAMNLDPNLEQATNNFCSVLGQQKRTIESQICFQNLLMVHPRSMPASYNLGVTYVEAGMNEEALKIWKNALIIEPDHQQIQAAVKKLESERKR